jgi:hypothetical protein
MTWAAVGIAGIGAAGSIGGGLIGSNAAKATAQDQKEMAATQTMRNALGNYSAQQAAAAQQSPYSQYGLGALPQLQYMLTGQTGQYNMTPQEQTEYQDLMARKAEIQANLERELGKNAQSPSNQARHAKLAAGYQTELTRLGELEQKNTLANAAVNTAQQFGPGMGGAARSLYDTGIAGNNAWNQNAQNFYGSQQYDPRYVNPGQAQAASMQAAQANAQGLGQVQAGQVDPSMQLDYQSITNDPMYQWKLEQAKKMGLTSLSKLGSNSSAGFSLLGDLGMKTANDTIAQRMQRLGMEKQNQFQNVGNTMQADMYNIGNQAQYGLANAGFQQQANQFNAGNQQQANIYNTGLDYQGQVQNAGEDLRAFGVNYGIGTDQLNQQNQYNQLQNAYGTDLYNRGIQDYSLSQAERQQQINNLMAQMGVGANAAGITGQNNIAGATNLASTNSQINQGAMSAVGQQGNLSGQYLTQGFTGALDAIGGGIQSYMDAPMKQAFEQYIRSRIPTTGIGTSQNTNPGSADGSYMIGGY